jgi:hypothetical protein
MRRSSILLVAVLALGVVVLGPGSAWAHEERTVGRFAFAVGFGTEPAYAGQENSVQLFLHDAATDRPIDDLGPTLRVQVEYQGRKMPPLVMEPDFEIGESGTPGDYRALFFPTRPGDYTFHLSGTVEGQAVDETFTSGPKTFSSVQDPADAEFPAKDPTAGELAQAVERLGPRVDRLVSGQNDAAARAEDAADAARSAKSEAAVALAVGGTLGLAGVALAAWALRRTRRSAAAPSAGTPG